MSLRTADYDYTLPEELIARYPTERRDGSRMMVLHRNHRRPEPMGEPAGMTLVAPASRMRWAMIGSSLV